MNNRLIAVFDAARREELIDVLPNVRRFAVSLAGNLADADDLLQATVERLLTRGLPDDATLLPWAMKVCRNLWIDEMRAQKVRRNAAMDPELAGAQVLHGDRQQLATLSLGEVQRTLADMPEEQRAVLELVAVEGFSYKQAAAALDAPIGTIMSRLARARAALAARLDPAAGNEPAGDRT